MSRATNRTSNISVTWNFKNPNISRNELINFIHLFREVSGYSRGLSRYCLAVFVRRHISIFILHRTPARKFPERISSPIQRPPESLLTTPPEISRFLLPLDSLRPHCFHQAPHLHFHQSPARRFPERISSPSQRPLESSPTTPPEISRFPFGTKVIKILDLSPYLPPTRPFAVSPTLSYSPKPVLHQPCHQTESAPLVHQSPCTFYSNLTLSYNNTHQSSSSPTTPPDRIHFSHSSIAFHVLSSSHPVLQQHSSVQFITNHATRPNPLLSFINLLARSILISPCLTTTLISPVHHFLQLPSSLSRQAHPHCYPSDWEFRTRRAGNCTEFEAVSTYVTLKK